MTTRPPASVMACRVDNEVDTTTRNGNSTSAIRMTKAAARSRLVSGPGRCPQIGGAYLPLVRSRRSPAVGTSPDDAVRSARAVTGARVVVSAITGSLSRALVDAVLAQQMGELV